MFQYIRENYRLLTVGLAVGMAAMYYPVTNAIITSIINKFLVW